MKNRIYNLLKNGYTETKKYTEQDLIKYLYPLKYIIQTQEYFIGCKRNKFWDYTNNENRWQLMDDISQIHRAKVTDTAYFRIINRFENGDRYGIEIQ
jgi:hypothetical protein